MGDESTTTRREPLLISVKEMATMLGISRNQAYVLLDQGRIESCYMGRRRLVVLRSVHKFVDGLPRERP